MLVTAFDELVREEQEPATHTVGLFDYLNASGRPEAAVVRALVDRWVNDYPAAEQRNLIGRIRSRHDDLHRSALFELMLHALMLRQGFAVLAIEPELPNGRAPDFLVEAPDGSRFFLEATVASGMNHVEVGADRRMREALQAIDDVQSPEFFLHLTTQGLPFQPVAVGRLRRAVQEFGEGLDHELAVADAGGGLADVPVWRHEEHGAQFTIRPVPKRAPGANGRAIGGRVLPGGIVQPEAAIRSAIERKAGRYGEIDLPLVIAVNALETFADTTSAIDALFGTVGMEVGEGVAPRAVRFPDGAWRGPHGPINRRSSAVLFVNRLSAWSIAQRRIQLIVNPWALNPLGSIPLDVDRYQANGEDIEMGAGQSLREIFDLPEGWPE